MDKKDIIIILLILILLYFGCCYYNNNERFTPILTSSSTSSSTTSSITDTQRLINTFNETIEGRIDTYLSTRADISITESIKNLGLIAQHIQNTDGNLVIPANVQIRGKLSVINDIDDSEVLSTDNNSLKVSGKFNLLPRGCILMWGSLDIPYGWVECNGENNGTPDLRGRFILGKGKGSNLTNRNINHIGGNENALVNHRHYHRSENDISSTQLEKNINSRKQEYTLQFKQIDPDTFFGEKSDYPTTFEAGKYGGAEETEQFLVFTGEPSDSNNHLKNHTEDSMPPYYVLVYIMKIY